MLAVRLSDRLAGVTNIRCPEQACGELPLLLDQASSVFALEKAAYHDVVEQAVVEVGEHLAQLFASDPVENIVLAPLAQAGESIFLLARCKSQIPSRWSNSWNGTPGRKSGSTGAARWI